MRRGIFSRFASQCAITKEKMYMNHIYQKNHFKETHVKSPSSGMNFCSSWMIFVHMHQGTTRDSNYTPTKCKKKRLLNRMWVNGMMPFLSESQKHIKMLFIQCNNHRENCTEAVLY